jgi:hypothetical protein
MGSHPFSEPIHPLGKPDPEIGWGQFTADRAALDGGNGPGHGVQYAWQSVEHGVLLGLGPTVLTPAGEKRSPDSVVDRLIHAVSWHELRHWAEMLLGPESFGLGVCCGIVGNIAGSVVGLLDLLKMFVLADLYRETVFPPPSWRSWVSPNYLIARGAQVMLGPQMKEAYERREALVKELKEVMKHPIDFLGKTAGNLKKGYEAKWIRYQALSAQTSLTSQFEAGQIFGETLVDVVMAILTFIGGVGAVAKLGKWAAEIPELLKVAEAVKGAGTAEAIEGAAGTADAAAAVEEIAEVKKPATPMEPEVQKPQTRKPRKPSKKNKNIDHSRTVRNPDGSTTFYDKSGRAVTYSKEGYPDFSPYAEAEIKVEGLRGTIPPDDKLANQAVGLSSTPDGYTWHHVEDGSTMQLLPSDIHATFPHTGGASLIRGQQ